MTEAFFRGLRTLCLALIGALCAVVPLAAQADGSGVEVQLGTSKAVPRKVESETERRIAADYRLAWTNIAEAFGSGAPAPLDGLFVGPAKQWLNESVSGQKRSGLVTKYSDQNHKLETIFYSPEGDVIELHDTAAYRLRVLDGSKLINDDRGVHYFLVLMTPAADRWVIRQLLEVPQF